MKRQSWTAKEIAVLQERYPIARAATVAAELGRTEKQVYAKANLLGLHKTAEFLSSAQSGRLRKGSHPNSVACRFLKGQTPLNKGLRRPGWAPGRMAETQFKPGVRQGVAVKLYQPIGTERISKDGYTERKVNDGMPLQKRWRAVHLVRWEEINGPLPPGHALVFRDGNKTNTEPSNMELVSRAELMRRNSYHTRYPKEIAQLIQLRGALNRKINKLEKANEEQI